MIFRVLSKRLKFPLFKSQKTTLLRSFSKKKGGYMGVQNKQKRKGSKREKRLELNKARKMRDNTEEMRKRVESWMENLKDNTPILFGVPYTGLIMLSTYFTYKTIGCDFHDPLFTQSFQNMRTSLLSLNFLHLGCFAFFDTIKLRSRPGRAKVESVKSSYLQLATIPALFMFFVDSNFPATHILSPILLFVTQGICMYTEGRATAGGAMPYWYWALRYRIHFFILLSLILSAVYSYLRSQDKQKKPQNYEKNIELVSDSTSSLN